MRLTNYIREAFIRSVMNDVPVPRDYDSELRKLVTKDFVDALPAPVRKCYEDEKTRKYVTSRYFSMRHARKYVSFYVPGCDDGGDLSMTAKRAAEALMEEWSKSEAERTSLEERLKQIVSGASTRKALAEALPEFQKYLPAEVAAPARSLPVVANVVADFVKAGWPKGMQPA
jgi:hypothetical protein